MKNLVVSLAALAMIAAPIAASAQPFGYGHGGGNGRTTWTSNSNRDWNGARSDYGRGDYGRGAYGRGDQRSFRRGYDRGDNTGALVAAGVLGLFMGAVLSNANDDNGYRYSQPYDVRTSYGYDQDW